MDYKVIDWPDEKVFRDNVTSKEIFKSALTLSTDDPVACEVSVLLDEFMDSLTSGNSFRSRI